MTFPIGGDNGWEAVGITFGEAPERFLLPQVQTAAYYDPNPLGGIGAVVEAVILTEGASGTSVKRRTNAVEALFSQPEVFGDTLLDSFYLPPVFPPCALLLTVYETDRETVDWTAGTDPEATNPYLKDVSRYSEQQIDVAQGGATLTTVTLTIIDRRTIPGDQDSGWVTARLYNLQGRRAKLERYVDELTTVILADGPLAAPDLSDFPTFDLTIRDTRDTERKLPLFADGVEQSLLPEGLLQGFGNTGSGWLVDPAPVMHGTVVEIGDARSVLVSFTDSEAIRTMSFAAYQSAARFQVTGDAATNDATWVNRSSYWLRWRLAGGTDWIELRSNLAWILYTGTAIDPWNFVVRPVGSPVVMLGIFLYNYAASPAVIPADGDSVELQFIGRRGVPPDTDHPIYVDGLTTGQFLQNAYDGIYSPLDEDGAIVPTGIRYDPAALAQMTDPVRFRTTASFDNLRDWTEKQVYAPTGWVPALDSQGRISPISQDAPAVLDGFPSLTDAITLPEANWVGGPRLLNVIRFTYPRIYRPAADAEYPDGLSDEDIIVEYRDQASVLQNGEQLLELAGTAFAAVGLPTADPVTLLASETGYLLAADRGAQLLSRYSLGAPTMNLTVRRSYTPTLRAGSWVLLDLSWLPDYVTGRRGLIGLAQVIAIGDLDCAWRRVTIEQVPPITEGS